MPSRTFCPLFVLVRNTDKTTAFRDTVILQSLSQSQGNPSRELRREISLNPGQERWLSFPLFTDGSVPRLKLEWTDLNGLHLHVFRDGERSRGHVCIVIDSAATSGSQSGILPTFPEAAFPRFVTELDGLDLVALDAVPNWTPIQTQAFLDWLHRGGKALILHSDRGTAPEFTGDLALLNSSRSRFSVGSGIVFRQPMTRDRFDGQALQSLFPEPVSNRFVQWEELKRKQDSQSFQWGLSHRLFALLGRDAAFYRNWPAIILAILAYLAMLFPVCYRIGHRERNVRKFYWTFAATVMGFSVAFWLLGQLGSGTQNRSAVAVLAKRIHPGVYDVTQWAQLSSSRGGVSTVHFPGVGLLYDSAGETRPLTTEITPLGESGASLLFRPASMSPLVSRSLVPVSNVAPTITRFQSDGTRLEEFTLSNMDQPDLPVRSAFVVFDRTVYPLERQAESMSLTPRQTGIPLDSFLIDEQPLPRTVHWWHDSNERKPVRISPPFQRDQELQQVLLGHSFLFRDGLDLEQITVSPFRVRVGLLTGLPDSLCDQSNQFPIQSGDVLWIYDFPAASSDGS